MADTEKPSSPVKTSSGVPPESPTTARPLDFDEDSQDAGTPHTAQTESTNVQRPGSRADAPPAKPPRPLSAREQAENTLKDAFPTIDASVVKAVLTASGGQVEPAFNALLGMSDPDSQQQESEPPVKPPRPTQQFGGPTPTAQSQLEADEMYARQLQDHYAGTTRQQRQQQQPPRQDSYGYNRQTQAPKQRAPASSRQVEPERSFIDDDLPVIRDNIKKGFLETQSTVNKWVATLRKKIDGEDEEDFESQPARPAQGYQSGPQTYNTRSGDMARRSADRDRYDADPELIGDDFSKLELRDAEGNTPAKRSNRPLANPDLFKPTPAPPSIGRKVSFQDGPPEEIRDMYSSSPKPATARPQSGGKTSKWQPLTTIDPSPVADNDPFSLGDSDDDKDAKPRDGKSDETERLQKATAEAMSDSIGVDAKSGFDKNKPAA